MICATCYEAKPSSEFYIDRNRRRGRVARCKACYSITQRTVGRMKPYRRRSEIRLNAQRRGIEWGLTKGQFIAFWQKPCAYCGSAIPTIGLDRLDSGKGYVVGNVIPCCGTCNRMKSDMTLSDFLAHVRAIVTNAANASIALEEARR